MNYLKHDITDDELKSGYTGAAIGLTACLPALVFLFTPHFLNFDRSYAYLFVAIGLVVGSYVAVNLYAFRRRGRVARSPVIVFVLTVALMAAAAAVNGVAGGASGFFRLPIILFTLYIATVGDRAMVTWFFVAQGACLALSSWVSGDSGGGLVATWVIEMSVTLAIVTIIRYPILGRLTSEGTIAALQKLTDVALESTNVEEGLAACLPMVDAAFPTDRVVAYLRRQGEAQFSPVAVWPEATGRNDEEDRERQFVPAFSQAVSSNQSVSERGWCYIPIGFTVAGDLVLVIRRRNSGERQAVLSPELLEALAASFMRLSGQVTNLSHLKGLTKTDPVTGLGNRRALSERSETEIVHAARNGTPLSLAMIEIDGFTEYNDLNGHLAGEALLSDSARVLLSGVRSQDFVARYKGAEFCVVLPETDIGDSMAIVGGIRENVRSVDARSTVSICVGLASWNGYEDFEDLVGRADVALRRAKTAGPGHVECFSN